MASLATPVLAKFRDKFGSGVDARVFRAPGRVNLIGEHTDYNLGLVLPMAIDLACYAATAPSGDGWLRVYSEQFAEAAEWPLNAIASATPRGHWSDRVLGVAWEILKRGGALNAQHLLIDSTLPVGAGLSSSAALGVTLALAFGGPRTPAELTSIAHRAEVDFVGVPCGVMDQFTSAHGVEGSAILLDCRTLKWRAVKLPPETAVIAVNTMVRHDLTGSGYRERVKETSRAASALGLQSLRDAQIDDLARLAGVLNRRARHILTENARVEQFVAACEADNCEGMGQLLLESHKSLRDDYEVSSPELDFLVEAAIRLDGVYGARMTGGGFGGSVVVLARSESTGAISAALASAYHEHRGTTPGIHVCAPSRGACEIIP